MNLVISLPFKNGEFIGTKDIIGISPFHLSTNKNSHFLYLFSFKNNPMNPKILIMSFFVYASFEELRNRINHMYSIVSEKSRKTYGKVSNKIKQKIKVAKKKLKKGSKSEKQLL